MIYKVSKSDLPLHLLKYIPEGNHSYNNRVNKRVVKGCHCRAGVFKNLFFPYTILEQNKLDLQIHKVSSLLSFKDTKLKLGPSAPNSYFKMHNPVDLKLLTSARV